MSSPAGTARRGRPGTKANRAPAACLRRRNALFSLRNLYRIRRKAPGRRQSPGTRPSWGRRPAWRTDAGRRFGIWAAWAASAFSVPPALRRSLREAGVCRRRRRFRGPPVPTQLDRSHPSGNNPHLRPPVPEVEKERSELDN